MKLGLASLELRESLKNLDTELSLLLCFHNLTLTLIQPSCQKNTKSYLGVVISRCLWHFSKTCWQVRNFMSPFTRTNINLECWENKQKTCHLIWQPVRFIQNPASAWLPRFFWNSVCRKHQLKILLVLITVEWPSIWWTGG